MMRFTLRQEPPLRLAADALVPERLAGRSRGEIERLPLAIGNRPSMLGDWFRVSGEAEATLAIEGPCRRLDRIGAGMGSGSRIVVEGDAGAYLGLGLRGGAIEVAGNAGFGAATDMQSGVIRIAGNAGDGVGGALPGAAGGMSDGAVIIGGRAGAAAGARLRRGLIAVVGDVGEGCGAGMLAGTIVGGGTIARGAGAAMRRGTIVALGRAPHIGACFADCGVHDLVVLRLLARELDRLGVEALAARIGSLRRFMGDGAVSGRGEMFIVG
ncbi:MAG TPA: formylmethanofuran dehydrogenase subunit C [Stellaceae bacterium]|nr:formylmethanofuran dehydrogenase subunit C [Stellaceae bacterium]